MLKGVRLTCQASTFRGLCINCDKVMKSISSSMAAPKHAESRAADSSLATPEASTRVTRKDQLELAREDVKTLVSEKFCHPIIVRLAWHDSGTYDKNISKFPDRGGANGSVRLPPELNHKHNMGLEVAVNLLQPIADKFKDVSYADLYQMASVTAIEMAGGPHIPLRYGRKDAPGTESPIPIGRLPTAAAPYQDGASGPAEHLRNIFGRMGFTDQEHVVLAGGQTLGRCHPERSGFGKPVTKYTEHGPGKPGGSPWTPDWLTFNNNYYKKVKAQDDPDLVVLETDDVLFKEPGFRLFAEKYEQDQDAFFKDYTAAHIKLSELGVEWQGQPFTLEPEEQTPDPKVEERLKNLQVSEE